MSVFGGLHIANSGLFANQKALEIISKNIANANTVGYSRQQVLLTPAAYDMGVEISSVIQVREEYLDSQYRSELCRLGEWRTRTEAFNMIEDFFKEPSEQGLNHAIGVFFNSIQELSKNPESMEIRTQALQNALTLTDSFHYIYDKLIELQDNQNSRIESAVSEINKLATEIVELNKEIKRYEIRGDQKENDLRDLRNNVIDKLSELINITVGENPDGTVSVRIGDEYLVDSETANRIETVLDSPNMVDGENMLYSVRWADSGELVEITSGKVKGFLDIRDGCGITEIYNPKFYGIPFFVNEINLLAKTLIGAINDIHRNGYTIPNDSNGNTSETGLAFFVPEDIENAASAKNISVSQYIIRNVYNIATSDEPVDMYNQGNNVIIKQIADLRDKKNIMITIGGVTTTIGSFEGYTNKIASELAVVSDGCQTRFESQEIITRNVENKRLSVSGVSIDEEMTNMIKFQNAYVASARVITSINTMLEALLNI